MLSGVLEDPPLDQGMMWSKCRSSVAPHLAHLPSSRFQTSNLTLVGMTLRIFGCDGIGWSKSSSPSTATSLNLKTLHPSLISCQESTR